MVQKRRVAPAPSIAAASSSDLRDRLEAGDEEQEIVADLLPGGGADDQRHGLVAVEQRIPGDAELAQRPGEGAEGGVEQEQPEHAGDGGGDGVGPDQQGAIEALAADDLLGLDREQQRDRHREEGGPGREDQRDLDRVEVGGIGEDARGSWRGRRTGSTGRTDPRAAATGAAPGRRPVEEDQADRELRGDQQVGKQAMREGGAHRSARPVRTSTTRRTAPWRRRALPKRRRRRRDDDARRGRDGGVGARLTRRLRQPAGKADRPVLPGGSGGRWRRASCRAPG